MVDANAQADEQAIERTINRNNKCVKLLQQTQRAHAESQQYDSAKTRKQLTQMFIKKTGKSPYKWQFDVAEAIILDLNCIVLAGTGSGKSMPFVMPLMQDAVDGKIIIIVCPLIELQEDQVRRSADPTLMGIYSQ